MNTPLQAIPSQWDENKTKRLKILYEEITPKQKIFIFLHHQKALDYSAINQELGVSRNRLGLISVDLFGKRPRRKLKETKRYIEKLRLTNKQKIILDKLLVGDINGKKYENIPLNIIARLSGVNIKTVKLYKDIGHL